LINFLSARFRLFIVIIGLISFLTVLAQIIFQSILLANKSYVETINNCKQKPFFAIEIYIKSILGTELSQVLRYFGLERFVLEMKNISFRIFLSVSIIPMQFVFYV
jgi:hypothetical protein